MSRTAELFVAVNANPYFMVLSCSSSTYLVVDTFYLRRCFDSLGFKTFIFVILFP